MSEYLVSGTQVDGRRPRSFSSLQSASLTAGDSLAESITRKASTQTYYTIRLLADRPLVDGAYRAYAYFRWVDDVLDLDLESKEERLAFLQRQKMIVDRCYRGEWPGTLCPEEELVADLIACDMNVESGLHAYISQMMAVMAYDAGRKGRLISQLELDIYTLRLSMAVTEALHYFIGHDCASPLGEARYLAVSAAHITHMLRDAVEDTENGYYNIPREYLEEHGLTPAEINNVDYQNWVKSRVKLARKLFAGGKRNLSRVENVRCRLAGYAYIARFEVILDAIEKDGYLLREAYPERMSRRAALKVGVNSIFRVIRTPEAETHPIEVVPDAVRRVA
jgi:phytoene/squalene synthetase